MKHYKQYKVEVEFTNPTYVVADSVEDAIQVALDQLIETEEYEAEVTEIPDDDDYQEYDEFRYIED